MVASRTLGVEEVCRGNWDGNGHRTEFSRHKIPQGYTNYHLKVFKLHLFRITEGL